MDSSSADTYSKIWDALVRGGGDVLKTVNGSSRPDPYTAMVAATPMSPKDMRLTRVGQYAARGLGAAGSAINSLDPTSAVGSAYNWLTAPVGEDVQQTPPPQAAPKATPKPKAPVGELDLANLSPDDLAAYNAVLGLPDRGGSVSEGRVPGSKMPPMPGQKTGGGNKGVTQDLSSLISKQDEQKMSPSGDVVKSPDSWFDEVQKNTNMPLLKAGVAMLTSNGDIWDQLGSGFGAYGAAIEKQQTDEATKLMEERKLQLEQQSKDAYTAQVQAQIAQMGINAQNAAAQTAIDRIKASQQAAKDRQNYATDINKQLIDAQKLLSEAVANGDEESANRIKVLMSTIIGAAPQPSLSSQIVSGFKSAKQ